jgi:ribonuclease P protein component
MLPSSHRLPHGKRLPTGRTFKHPLFLVKVAPNSEANSRFGIIISKKIDKRAVKRNRMRRLLQQFIQSHLSLFPHQADFLFIVHNAFEMLPEDLESELTRYFKQNHEKNS